MLPYKCKLRSYGPSIAFLAFAMLKFLLKDFIPFSILWELCCTANVFIMCMYVTFDAILESAVEGLLLKPFLPWQCPLDNPTVNHNDLDVIFKPFTLYTINDRYGVESVERKGFKTRPSIFGLWYNLEIE